MSGNFYEDELRRSLRSKFQSEEIRDLGDSSEFFDRLMEYYPTSGSKINWRIIPNSIEELEENIDLQSAAFSQFFDALIAKFGLVGNVIYAGDSLTDAAFEGDLIDIRESLPELLEIPHHHYFIASDFSWCICLTMEGDMGFGFNPSFNK